MRVGRSVSLIVGLGLALLLLQSCGDAEELTQDAAQPVTEAANTDPADTEDFETTTSTTEATATSFSADVKPVLEANCVSCHSDNGPGTTHLEMATAGDLASNADFIAFRVENREMPPWPLSPLTQISYNYDLSMSDEDRQVIIDWAAEGGELDVEPDSPLVSTSQAYPPIEADLVLAADEPYPGSDALDDYRCRVLDPELESDTWIKAFDVRQDETRVLHHSLIFLADAELKDAADQLDGSDGLPGWQCQTIPRVGGQTLFQAGGWAPGTGPIVAPEGAGFEMSAGDFLVVQWHYHYDGEVYPDNSGLGIEFVSDEELAAAGGSLTPVDNEILFGPVEIPCATYESGPLCDRDAAMARVQREFGFESTFIPRLVNAQCGVTPEDFAHMTDGVASSSCDMRAPRGEVISIWPHMHELGTTYRMTLNPDTPDEVVLIDIDRWNFDWQMGYDPVDQLVFEAGDTLRIECGWDRALWPVGVESRYVVWAEGTQDEMCYTGVALLDG